MGRSSLTFQGISVHLRIIDSDHVEEIIDFISVSTIWVFRKDENIVQILLHPYGMHD